jgi:hypothetical protein
MSEVLQGTVTSVAAYGQSLPTGRQPACAAKQTKPANTSQSELYAH